MHNPDVFLQSRNLEIQKLEIQRIFLFTHEECDLTFQTLHLIVDDYSVQLNHRITYCDYPVIFTSSTPVGMFNCNVL